MNDIFVIWNHSGEELNGFIVNINGISPNIQSIMVKEEGEQLPFSDMKKRLRGLGDSLQVVYKYGMSSA